MPIDIGSFVGLAGIPLVQALVAICKTAFPTPTFPARYYPGLSVFWGIVLNLALAYLLGTDLRVSVLVGIVTGLAASGLFAYGKAKEQELLHG